ncbi:collagen alpha-1(I) chain-like [Iris pallida]|uniref:Collagen alpha-1(I) chain-like n=1 Tax=Iris pallida TaxID=29817 RepID=A0AAX6FWL5_IRIPA|nr:collagen alpha-1(I) chain-like [Iris pallida]
MPERVGGSRPPRWHGVLAREGRRSSGRRRRRRRRREADGSSAKVRTAAAHHPRPRGLASAAALDTLGSFGVGRPGTTERDSSSESG